MSSRLKFILFIIVFIIFAILSAFIIYRVTTAPIADHFEVREKIIVDKMERYEIELKKLSEKLDAIEIKYDRKRDEVREYIDEKHEEYTNNPDKYIDDFLEFINQ
jgi:F0F1-type ATP synthase membrane subunit b/b'